MHDEIERLLVEAGMDPDARRCREIMDELRDIMLRRKWAGFCRLIVEVDPEHSGIFGFIHVGGESADVMMNAGHEGFTMGMQARAITEIARMVDDEG